MTLEDWYRHGNPSKYMVGHRSPGTLDSSLWETFQPAGDMSDPPTPDIALVLPLPGSSNARIDIDVGAGRFEDRVRQNHLFMQPANTINKVLIDGPHRLLALTLPLARANTALVDAGLPAVADFGRLHAHYFVDSFVEHGLLRLHDWCGPAHAAHGLARESLLLTMLVRLGELAGSSRRSSGSPWPQLNAVTGGLAVWQIRRVIDRLQLDLARSPRLDELASLVGLSQFHFCRAFKKSTDQSPMQYLIGQRIARATQLLTATQSPIAEIATEVGYDDPAYFSRLYRLQTGRAPSAVRRKNDRSVS